MSSNTYQFTIQGTAITQVKEWDDGVWKTERIGSSEHWIFDASTGFVSKTETEHGYTKTRTYTDLDGDGIFNNVSSSSPTPSSSNVNSMTNNFASSIKLYDFTIDSNNAITAVFENENGSWQNERISWNENWHFNPITNIVTKTEDEQGRLETTTFVPDGSGHFTKGIQTYQIGVGSTTLINDSYNDEILYGFESADRINGGEGDDYIESYSGNDHLNGSQGNDILNGGLGADELTGGSGHDAFIYNTKLSSSSVDIILDFEDSIDSIHLDDSIFKKLKNDGDLNDNIVVGTRALDRNDYLIYNDITDVLYYDADGSGRGAQVAISVVSIGSVDASDFVVI